MPKREYLKDYVEAEDGSYSYTGAHWAWPSTETRTSCLKSLWLFFAAILMCIIVAGCLPAAGSSGAAYVVIPYAASIVGIALTATSLVRLTQEANPMRAHIYERSVPALPAKLMFTAASALLCGCALLVHTLVFVSGASLMSALFILCMLCAAVLAYLAHRLLRNVSFTKQDSETS